jgi:ribosomal protein S12 methylthiotransferase
VPDHPHVAGSPPVVSLVNLGCPKNTVDSEHLLGRLAECGYVVAADPEAAQVVLVNTCGFITAAKEESIEALLDVAALKDEDTATQRVVALGCLVERHGDELAREMPEIDAWVGFGGYDRLPQIVDGLLQPRSQHQSVRGTAPDESGAFLRAPRLPIAARHSAYLKISEGCDHTCAFCAIPQMRGRHVSRSLDYVLAQARALIDGGARELVLIAQDTTAWGRDLPGKPRLADLLRALLELDGYHWLRLMYGHPAHLRDEVIDLLAEDSRLCPYIDLPIQHSHPDALARMRRGTGSARLRKLLGRLRDAGIAIRSTLIAGYPGETEAEHADCLALVESGVFTHLGVFAYSPEEGTAAATAPDPVADAVADARRHALLTAQQAVAFARLDAQIGSTLPVMVDEPVLGGDGLHMARTAQDAPQIDGAVLLQSDRPLAPGSLVEARIDGREDYDLIATAGATLAPGVPSTRPGTAQVEV